MEIIFNLMGFSIEIKKKKDFHLYCDLAAGSTNSLRSVILDHGPEENHLPPPERESRPVFLASL